MNIIKTSRTFLQFYSSGWRPELCVQYNVTTLPDQDRSSLASTHLSLSECAAHVTISISFCLMPSPLAVSSWYFPIILSHLSCLRPTNDVDICLPILLAFHITILQFHAPPSYSPFPLVFISPAFNFSNRCVFRFEIRSQVFFFSASDKPPQFEILEVVPS